MSNIITDNNFENDVINSEQLVLIDFWAEWCGPCKQLSPILDEVSRDMEGKMQIFKMNIDDNPETPTKYGVRSIPTLMLFKKGEVVSTKIGAVTKTAMLDWIKENS